MRFTPSISWHNIKIVIHSYFYPSALEAGGILSLSAWLDDVWWVAPYECNNSSEIACVMLQLYKDVLHIKI